MEFNQQGGSRQKIWLLSLAITGAIVFLLNISLPKDWKAWDLFAGGFFSVQTFMWMFFFAGFAELLVRRKSIGREGAALNQGFLPEEPGVLLTARDVGPIYKRVASEDEALFLPGTIKRIVLQFQSTNSVEQSSVVLNSSMELGMHQIDLRYNMLRYIMWIIPTLGFIGTVIGIAAGLDTAAEEFAPGAAMDLSRVTKDLGVAFYTTLLALAMSSIIVLLTQLSQAREENGLNESAQYCLDNLINRLYDPEKGT